MAHRHTFSPRLACLRMASLGRLGNRPGCKCTKEELRAYVRRVHDADGVVTIDFHIRQDCTFDADQLEVLSGIR